MGILKHFPTIPQTSSSPCQGTVALQGYPSVLRMSSMAPRRTLYFSVVGQVVGVALQETIRPATSRVRQNKERVGVEEVDE